MKPDPLSILEERCETQLVTQTPTLDECHGCEDCRGLFRRPIHDKCPYCGGSAIWNVAAVLAGGIQ